MKQFEKSFLQQEALPEAAIESAVEIMRSGRLHRYDATADNPGPTALLESEFAAYQGGSYCLACASCGYALYIAMLAAGVKPGDVVLCNAFTLAPVPGAINNCGAIPLLVETSSRLTIDLFDLEAKADQADFLLLSHMRGHLADMDQVATICQRYKITLIEDCAHSLGAWWGDQRSGNFGEVSCFSTQSYKHLNSGEGGLLVTDNPELIAKAILLSGSYMLYDRHLAAPEPSEMTQFAKTMPNYSGRMDNLRATVLRAQLPQLDTNCARWNERYAVIAGVLAKVPVIELPDRNQQERFVGSSIQFLLPGLNQLEMTAFVSDCASRGIQLKYFGSEEPHGYTSRYDSWQYLHQGTILPATQQLLNCLVDMRISLTFDLDDCRLIAEIISEVATAHG